MPFFLRCGEAEISAVAVSAFAFGRQSLRFRFGCFLGFALAGIFVSHAIQCISKRAKQMKNLLALRAGDQAEDQMHQHQHNGADEGGKEAAHAEAGDNRARQQQDESVDDQEK